MDFAHLCGGPRVDARVAHVLVVPHHGLLLRVHLRHVARSGRRLRRARQVHVVVPTALNCTQNNGVVQTVIHMVASLAKCAIV